MIFPCTRCGQCCKNIGGIPQLKFHHSGDGVCCFYSERNGCLIYKDRPDVCRIDEGYSKFFSKQLSLDDYYKKNASICNELQETAVLDISYRIIIE